MRQHSYRLIVALAVLLLPVLTAHGEENYTLGPGDGLEVTISGGGDGECDQSEPLVGPDGTIQILNVGRIKVTGMTTTQVRNVIKKRLKEGQIFLDASVAVNIKSHGSRPVNVAGAVGSPQRLLLTGPTYLRDALAEAGGVDAELAGLTIRVTRKGQARPFVVQRAELFGGDADAAENANIRLQAHDDIFVDRKQQFCITGAVETDGCYDVDRTTTLLSALALAGGLKNDEADRSRLAIQRNGENLVFDLDEIESLRVLPPRIEGGDQVIVLRKLKADFCIQGPVETPDCYEFTRGLTLRDAIAKAGGLKIDEADTDDIKVQRGSRTFELSFEDPTGASFPLERGDSITVGKAELFVTVSGVVAEPGRKQWYPGMTIVDAIAEAGGVDTQTGWGSMKKVTLTRGGQTTTINIKRMYSGEERAMPLEPGDRIFVPRRKF